MKNKGGVVKVLMWIFLFPVMLILAILKKDGWSGKRKATIIVGMVIAIVGLSIGGADDAAATGIEPLGQVVEDVQKTEEKSAKPGTIQENERQISDSEEQESQDTVEKSGGINSEVHDSGNEQVLQVHFLDVGQALSVLVMDMQGNELLYDAGNEGDADFIISYLRKLGVDRLEVLVNSHPHEDHIGGMDRVLEEFEVDQVILSEKTYDSQAYRDVVDILDEKQIDIAYPKSGATYALGELSIQILGPQGFEYVSTNDYSVIVKVGNGSQSVLLTGDSEATAEHELVESGVDLQADVFQVSHHGSSTSNTIQYLSKVDPQVAVISVGANNTYGHPDATILDRLRNMGISTYETDLDGTIVMTLDGAQIFVEAKGDTRPNDSVEDTRIVESSESTTELDSEEIDQERDVMHAGVVIVELDKRAEYVMIQNVSSEAVDLSGWRIESINGGQAFIFPTQTWLDAGGCLKITSGNLAADGDFMMAKGNVWNNQEQDSARLTEPNGVEVDFFEDTNYE